MLLIVESPDAAFFGVSRVAALPLSQVGKRTAALSHAGVDINPLLFPVLGRFVHALNGFCRDEYGWEYDVSDYWIYEYAKVCAGQAGGVWGAGRDA
jgi:hypothetical protein